MFPDKKEIDARINPICLATTGLYVYQLAISPYTINLIFNRIFDSPEYFLFYLVNYLIFPPAVILYSKHFRSGWILLTIYLVYISVSSLTIFLNQMARVDIANMAYFLFQLYDLALPVLIYIFILVYHNRSDISRYYRISNTFRYILIIFIFLLSLYPFLS